MEDHITNPDAEFCLFDESRIDQAGDTWTVTSCVTNSAGRSAEWIAEMKYLGDDRWRLLSLEY
jgi:hypothetical protein